jgi:hypothetical protein
MLLKPIFYLGLMVIVLTITAATAQTLNPKITISGTAGISYEHYGLMVNPKGSGFYTPRRPWNVLRVNLKPTIEFGKIKMPFNLSFIPNKPNFPNVPPVPGLPQPNTPQSLGQYFTNPLNNFGANPKYKWAELELGTQYLKYSDLSTGDISVFGYGFNLNPGKFRLRFFKGAAQQAINYMPTQPSFKGAYKRKIIMAQVGLEREGKYFTGFNVLKGDDQINSINTTLPNNILPEENVIVSFLTKVKTTKDWNIQLELGQCFFTKDKQVSGQNPIVKNFDPFIKTNISTYKDNAVQFSVSKRKANWELGISGRWLGAGYTTMGYPFTQNDRMEYSINSQGNLWKNKIKIVANIGQRYGNWSKALGPERNKQLIANTNINAQLHKNFNLNVGFNNFGFFAPSALPIGGIKNVGTDLSINPTYTYTSKTMLHLVSASYNWSKYDEITYYQNVPLTTFNNTQTFLLLYVPTWINKPYSMDFSVMHFSNTGFSTMIMNTISGGLNWNFDKKNIVAKTQLQYNTITLEPYTRNKNVLITLGIDWQIQKKITWNSTLTTSLYKYGDEFAPQYINPSYTETFFRTGFQYRFKKRTVALKKI